MKTSWRRLEDIFRLRLHKTSSRRLQDVLIETNIFALAMRLQKTSWRRLTKASSRRFQDVFKTSSKNVFKVSSRRLQDVLKTPLRRLGKISLRRFQDVSSSKTVLVNKPSSRIQYGSKRYCKDSYLKTVTLLRNLPSVYKISKSNKNFSSFSFSLYYTF